MENVKFTWNAIKADGKKALVWYSGGQLIGHPEGTITIYAKGYSPVPRIEGLTVQNDSEIMTDYFETDRIRVEPSNPWYPQVLEAMKAAQAHREKIANRHKLAA